MKIQIYGNIQLPDMPSAKRKALEIGLQRRVKARRESSEDVESVSSVPSLENGGELSNRDEEDSAEETEEEVCTLYPNVVHF